MIGPRLLTDLQTTCGRAMMGGIKLDPEIRPAELPCGHQGGTGATERVQYQAAWATERLDQRCE